MSFKVSASIEEISGFPSIKTTGIEKLMRKRRIAARMIAELLREQDKYMESNFLCLVKIGELFAKCKLLENENEALKKDNYQQASGIKGLKTTLKRTIDKLIGAKK
jgi:hypothetical protein